MLHRNFALRACASSALAAVVMARSDVARAAVCDASAFSCPSSGTCIISNTWLVGDGCILDFGEGSVEIKGTLQAETTGGSFVVRAGELTLTAGKLRSQGDSDEPGGDISVEIAGLFCMKGTGPRIDVSGNGGGGSIAMSAATVDLQSGTITASGGTGADCGDAGQVSLAALSGPIAIGAAVSANTGGHDCYGGAIDVSGESIQISSLIDARGGAGAVPDAIVAVAYAGSLAVTTAAGLKADGCGQPDGAGADAGGITLIAEGGDLSVAASPVSLAGNSPDGSGGDLVLSATGAILIGANVSVSGGSEGFGGEVSADAGSHIDVTGNITATGGMSFPAGEGGIVSFTASGEVLVSSTIDASGASGGEIAIENGNPVTITGTLRARGARGTGGFIEATGCSVSVSGTLDGNSTNGGSAGAIDLVGAAVALTSSASMTAAPCTTTGCTTITTAGSPPVIGPGATISPTPTIFVDPSLPPC